MNVDHFWKSDRWYIMFYSSQNQPDVSCVHTIMYFDPKIGDPIFAFHIQILLN